MFTRTLTLTAALALAILASGNAAAYLETVSEAIESSTRDVSIPSSKTGRMIVRKCSTCPTLTLRFTEGTRFYIGKQQVELQDFRKFANSGAHGLTIVYAAASSEISRMVVSGTYLAKDDDD